MEEHISDDSDKRGVSKISVVASFNFTRYYKRSISDGCTVSTVFTFSCLHRHGREGDPSSIAVKEVACFEGFYLSQSIADSKLPHTKLCYGGHGLLYRYLGALLADLKLFH